MGSMRKEKGQREGKNNSHLKKDTSQDSWTEPGLSHVSSFGTCESRPAPIERLSGSHLTLQLVWLSGPLISKVGHSSPNRKWVENILMWRPITCFNVIYRNWMHKNIWSNELQQRVFKEVRSEGRKVEMSRRQL